MLVSRTSRVARSWLFPSRTSCFHGRHASRPAGPHGEIGRRRRQQQTVQKPQLWHELGAIVEPRRIGTPQIGHFLIVLRAAARRPRRLPGSPSGGSTVGASGLLSSSMKKESRRLMCFSCPTPCARDVLFMFGLLHLFTFFDDVIAQYLCKLMSGCYSLQDKKRDKPQN